MAAKSKKRGEVQEGKSPSRPPYFFSQFHLGKFLPPPWTWFKIGGGQHIIPALSRKGSFLTFRASLLHQHLARRLPNHRMSCIRRVLWRKSPVRYSSDFLVGVCRPDLQILTLHFRPKNVVIHTSFLTWPLRNSVIITVMIRFSTFLSI